MLRSTSKQVLIFSPDINATPTIPLRSYNDSTTSRNQKRISRRFTSRLNGFLPIRVMRHAGANMVKALCLIRRRHPSPKRTSMVIPRRCVAPGDSHQNEAIDDCIEFIKSSHRKSI